MIWLWVWIFGPAFRWILRVEQAFRSAPTAAAEIEARQQQIDRRVADIEVLRSERRRLTLLRRDRVNRHTLDSAYLALGTSIERIEAELVELRTEQVRAKFKQRKNKS